jgi:hypothetical protein
VALSVSWLSTCWNSMKMIKKYFLGFKLLSSSILLLFYSRWGRIFSWMSSQEEYSDITYFISSVKEPKK